MEKFNLFIVDHDNKSFNVIENISSDDLYTELVNKAQQTRNVNCHISREETEKSIKNYEERMGYVHIKDSVL